MAHDHRDDPEVRYLAEEQGVSLNDAAERIRWQGEAMQLRSELAREFPDTYVALQVEPQDGDRLKLYVYDASPGALSQMKAKLQARDILAATDVVPASEPASADER